MCTFRLKNHVTLSTECCRWPIIYSSVDLVVVVILFLRFFYGDLICHEWYKLLQVPQNVNSISKTKPDYMWWPKKIGTIVLYALTLLEVWWDLQ